MKKIIFIDGVATALGLAVSTVRRKLGERRKGRGDMPLPISPPGCKCRWLASDIEAFLASQSTAPPIAPNVRQTKRGQKDSQQRQAAVKAALARHTITKKGGLNG